MRRNSEIEISEECMKECNIDFEESNESSKPIDHIKDSGYLVKEEKRWEIGNLKVGANRRSKNATSTKGTDEIKSGGSALYGFESKKYGSSLQKCSLPKLNSSKVIKSVEETEDRIEFPKISRNKKFEDIVSNWNKFLPPISSAKIDEESSNDDIMNISQSSISRRLDLSASSDSLLSLEELDQCERKETKTSTIKNEWKRLMDLVYQDVKKILQLPEITSIVSKEGIMSVPQMLKQKSDQTKLILNFIFSKNYEDPVNQGKKKNRIFLENIQNKCTNRTKSKYQQFFNKRGASN